MFFIIFFTIDKIMSSDSALSYNKNAQSNQSTYRMVKYTPLQGSSLTQGNSEVPVTFSLPGSDVYNLSKSYISWDQLNVLNAACTVYRVGAIPWNRIRLLSSNSVVIAEVSDVDVFSKTVSPANNPVGNYLTKSPVFPATTVAGVIGTNYFGAPCGNIPAASTALTSHAAFVQDNNAGVGVVDGVTNVPSLTLGVSHSHEEKQEYVVSTAGAAIATRNCVMFDRFCHTLLGLNKNIYTGSIYTLEIYWQPKDKSGYICTAVGDIVTGAASAAADTAVTNISLYLAVEMTSANIAKARSDFAENKMNFIVPFVQGYNFALGAGSFGNYTINLTAGLGKTLLRVYTTVILAANTLALAGNSTNHGGTKKVSSYQTQLDSFLLSNQFLDCTDRQDYKYNLKHLVGSELLIGGEIGYQNKSLYIDNFGQSSPACGDSDHESWSKMDDSLSGIDLDQVARLYSFSANKTSVNHVALVWAVLQRQISINNQGASWV